MALAIGMDLDAVKEKLQELGYTELQPADHPEAKWMPIATWTGESPFIRGAGPTGAATISYFIEGDKLRAHKALEGDSFYLLR